jgi:hypothetical protein
VSFVISLNASVEVAVTVADVLAQPVKTHELEGASILSGQEAGHLHDFITEPAENHQTFLEDVRFTGSPSAVQSVNPITQQLFRLISPTSNRIVVLESSSGWRYWHHSKPGQDSA